MSQKETPSVNWAAAFPKGVLYNSAKLLVEQSKVLNVAVLLLMLPLLEQNLEKMKHFFIASLVA